MELDYSEESIDEIGKYFDNIVQRIKSKKFDINRPPDLKKVCKECDFRFYCSEQGIISYKRRELDGKG